MDPLQSMNNGKIKIYIGPMFANKSGSMTGEVDNYHIANRLCVIVKYAGDDRYDAKIKHGGLYTHAGKEYHRVPVLKAKTLGDVLEEIEEYDVIGVDELQFFPDCVEVLQQLANHGKIIICSGLDGNFMAKPFGRMPEMMAMAEEIIKLKAVCQVCCREASFTKKISGGTEEVEIGGVDKYISVCRLCMWKS